MSPARIEVVREDIARLAELSGPAKMPGALPSSLPARGKSGEGWPGRTTIGTSAFSSAPPACSSAGRVSPPPCSTTLKRSASRQQALDRF